MAVARSRGHGRIGYRASATLRAACIARRTEAHALARTIQAGEHARAGNHLGLLRTIELHLDDVELEQRVRWVGRIVAVLAPGELGLGPRPLPARHVEVDRARIGRAGHDRVRVRAFAGLHVLHELRRLRIRHVEDPDTSHVILRILHAAALAIVAVARPLGGDEQQVAVNRRITLRGDALDHGRHGRLGGVGDVPDRETSEVRLVDVVGAESEVGVDERQAAHRVELRRLRRERQQLHVAGRDAGVEPPRLEVVPGV